MSITQKTVLAMAAVLAMMAGVVYLVSSTMLLDTFREVEEKDTQSHARRATEALNANLVALFNMTGDWSNWDDVYQFVQDGNEQFVETNIQGKAFQAMAVDVMVFVNEEAKVVKTGAFSRKNGSPIAFPSGLVETLTPGSPLLVNDEAAQPVSGVLVLPGGPVMVASRPILTSEYTGPSRGTMLMGVLLDEDMVHQLAETTHLNLSLSRTEDSTLSPAERTVLGHLTAGEKAVARPTPDGNVAGYTLVSDVFHNPAYLLTVTQPRTIYEQGTSTIRYFLIALAAISVVALVAILLLLQQLVLKRLSQISREVGIIGSSHDLSLRVSASGADELDRLVGVLNETLDYLQAAQGQLHASEARNRALVEAMPDALLTFRQDGSVISARPDRDNRLAGLCRDLQDGNLADRLPPDIAHKASEGAAAALRTGRPNAFEFQWDSGGGSLEYEARVVMNGPDEALAIVRDVSERRQLEEARRKELMLREIHHRVKNNLQVISSLLSLQSDKVEDPAAAEMLRESQNRVKTMALIHEKLYQSKGMEGINFGEYIRDLVAFLISSYRLGHADTSVAVNAQDVEMGLDKAVPCGLIVNELVSNALKHAFPHGRAGNITVDLIPAGGNGVELAVSDDGIGLPHPFDIYSTNSLGLRLVSSLADQLDASLDIRNGTGTSFRLCFATH